MNSFKQAMNQTKISLKWSLFLGLISTAFLFLNLTIVHSMVSSILLALGLLVFQQLAQHHIAPIKKPDGVKISLRDVTAYLLTSAVLFPTSVLMGSAIGMLESPQNYIASVPTAFIILVVNSYFYLILSHSLRYHLQSSHNIAKAIDIVCLASLKKLKLVFIFSLYCATFTLVAILTKGAGLIILLPLIFYMNHFTYLEMKY